MASFRAGVRLIDAPHDADILSEGFVPRRCAPHRRAAWRGRPFRGLRSEAMCASRLQSSY